MHQSFNEQFDDFSAWRRMFASRLKSLSGWLQEQDLLGSGVEERLRQLEAKIRHDKVMVAFVAEFSRGKSELINAIFFAGYGRRIMPATAGRTTMCPTELGYDAEESPCLRLLPIETRMATQSLMDWRLVPDQWERVDLEVTDPEQLAKSFEKVSEVKRVSVDTAKSLGLWSDDHPDDNPPVDEQGEVEVPRWRHALINIEHPLLKQGLVILDTPGLNAIGAEPELTMSLIPQAHAVVFILGADTGVTKSDLSIWREHLVTEESDSTRLAVLNKIDTLWDPLVPPEQVDQQIERQCQSTATTLGLERNQVVAISAHKGLLAKVSSDQALLRDSHLQDLESVLGEGLLSRRQDILRASVAANVQELRLECERVLRMRRRDLAEQMLELRGLRGKNTSVVRQMLSRVEQEKTEFSASAARIHAVRAVHLKMLRELYALLSADSLKQELKSLRQTLSGRGVRLWVKNEFADTFNRLRDAVGRAQGMCDEIHSMLGGSYRQLNAEYGFALHVSPTPDLQRYLQELDSIEEGHVQYLSVGNVFRLVQKEFADRLMNALVTRLRMVYEAAVGDVELWSRSCAAHLDTQMRERRKAHSRRTEALERVQDASESLEDRISQIEQLNAQLDQVQDRLEELSLQLLAGDETLPMAA
ncbi:MAG: hypothetical protein RLZZ271_545 [Pseudomonadota bacterium]